MLNDKHLCTFVCVSIITGTVIYGDIAPIPYCIFHFKQQR